MQIKEITYEEFENFIDTIPIGSFYQTLSYANYMQKNGFSYELIGYVDKENTIHAASFVFFKHLNFLFQYGYVPKGFLLDYFDNDLLKKFTEDLTSYYKKKRVVFLKINPEIATATIDTKTFQKKYNQNIEIKSHLIDASFRKLRDNLYFESQLPRYNAIVSLKNLSLQKNTRNKVRRGREKGLQFEVADFSGIGIFNDFIKRKKDSLTNYPEFYQSFFDAKMIDYFLVSIDTHLFLDNAKNAYEKELQKNSHLTEILSHEKTEKNKNKKMLSDKKLLAYKSDVMDAKSLVEETSKIYIAGALVVKYKNRISIVVSGYDKKYKHFQPNYFLHYEILKYYEKHYDFADLNGMTGDFTPENPYYGLNAFKLGFQPRVYEFLGEYDLPILPFVYQSMSKNGKLAKVFNKKYSKIK